MTFCSPGNPGHVLDDGPQFLVEDNGLGDIEEDPSLSNPLHCCGQDLALDIGPFLHQILGAHAVVNPSDPLLNNWTLIEICRDEMRRGTNNLHTTVVGLVVGLCTLERRQEAVVDVDNFATHGLAQHGGQDLHVPRQNNQLNFVLLDKLENLTLLLGLCVLVHRQVVELDTVALGKRLKVRVVGDDDGDVNPQLARLGTEEQVVQAVPNFGDHDEHAHLGSHRADVVVHFEVGSQGLKGCLQGFRGGDRTKVDAHEELFRYRVRELLKVHDIDVLFGKDASHGVDDAGLVWA